MGHRVSLTRDHLAENYFNIHLVELVGVCDEEKRTNFRRMLSERPCPAFDIVAYDYKFEHKIAMNNLYFIK